MIRFMILTISLVFLLGVAPRIKYSETKYMKVSANTTDSSGGTVIPNGEHISVYRFRANGADPSAYVILAWDYGGAAEKIFASTKGDIDIYFDVSIDDHHLTGDGSKKLQIIIVNDNSTETPTIGGQYETVQLDD